MAEEFVAMHAPREWFDDPHGRRAAQPARCCVMVEKIHALLQGVAEWK